MGLLKFLTNHFVRKEMEWEKTTFGNQINQNLKIKQHNAYLEKDYPHYKECAELFNYCVKNHRFNNELINDFRHLVDEHLGTKVDKYKNYKFKNDVNEIYVKLKDENLMRFDFKELNGFLTMLKDDKVAVSDVSDVITPPAYVDEKKEYHIPQHSNQKVIDINKYK